MNINVYIKGMFAHAYIACLCVYIAYLYEICVRIWIYGNYRMLTTDLK